MKISTKKIFRTLKNSPKIKHRTNQKPKMSSKYLAFNNISKLDNSNIKQNLFLKPICQTEKNPFSRPQNYTCKNKRKVIKRVSSQFNNFGINIENKNANLLIEDSYINNLLLTNETDSNILKNNIKTENNLNKKKEEDIDTLCNLFKKSNLNTAFVIDNKGNNNLNIEQKQIIDHYYNQKRKDISNKKINTIPVQKYKENKALFEVKSPLKNPKKVKKYSVILNNNDIVKNLNEYKKHNEKNKGTNVKKKIIHKKILSTQDANNYVGKFREFFGIKDEKEKENKEIDNNSIFENYTNKSIDSSFLGSSLDEEFYKNLADYKKKLF